MHYRAEALPTAQLALVTAVAAWAGNVIVARAARDLIDPVSLNLLRWAVALLLLLPFCLRDILRCRQVIRRHWRLLTALGVSGIGLFHVLQYAALQHTAATNVALYLATTPLLIILLTRLLLREPTTRRQLYGAAISLLGAATVASRGDLETLLALRFRVGDLLEIAGVLFWSLYCVLLRFRPPQLPALALVAVTSVPGLAVTALGWLAFEQRLVPSGTTALVVAYVGVFASALAYVCWNAGVALLGPTRAGIFSNLVPVFTALGGVLILGEQLESYHLTAAILVLVGIWFATTPEPLPR
jgi:drug/metabolite transporter (DMT)-like permease